MGNFPFENRKRTDNPENHELSVASKINIIDRKRIPRKEIVSDVQTPVNIDERKKLQESPITSVQSRVSLDNRESDLVLRDNVKKEDSKEIFDEKSPTVALLSYPPVAPVQKQSNQATEAERGRVIKIPYEDTNQINEASTSKASPYPTMITSLAFENYSKLKLVQDMSRILMKKFTIKAYWKSDRPDYLLLGDSSGLRKITKYNLRRIVAQVFEGTKFDKYISDGLISELFSKLMNEPNNQISMLELVVEDDDLDPEDSKAVLNDFISHCCRLSAKSRCLTATLFESYVDYCNRNDYEMYGRKSFTAHLNELAPKLKLKHKKMRISCANPQSGFVGIEPLVK